MSSEALHQRLEALELENARLRRLLDRQGSTAGLRHQVRNTLAMVRDVVRRSAESVAGGEDFAAHLDGRLDAILRVQNTIANGLADGVGLHSLLADEMLAQGFREGERVHLSGPDVDLRPAAASMLALAFHELATNAVKFGALSSSVGQIGVEWTAERAGTDEAFLVLRWIESGVAAMPKALARRGFGAEVIEQGLRYQFNGDGRLEPGAEGLRCTITLPLVDRIGALAAPDGEGPRSV